MSTGLFQYEEESYNIEETKYVLKGSAPSTDSSFDAGAESFDAPEEEEIDGMDAFDDAPEEGGSDKPFDDEPFDAGVEADEDTDPEKYIQQLSGKLGQSLRQYTEDEGQPDFDLEKFAVNSVLSATHTGEMDKDDQRDIIKKVKGSGNDENGGEEEVDIDIDVDEPIDGEEHIDFSEEEPVEEIVEELPLNQGDELPLGVPLDGGLGGCDKANPIDAKAVDILKDMSESENDTMLSNLKNMKTDTEKILSMDKDKLDKKLDGMGWAADHISTSTDDTEEVADYLTTEDKNPCWDGYKQVGMKDKGGKEVPNCVPVNENINEAEYQGEKVKLNKPMKGDVMKFKVYVKNDKGNVVKVNFGDKDMEIRRDDPEARKSFRARHKCDEKKDKTTAGYWSCKMWSSKSVSDILKESEKNSNFVDKTKLIEKLRLMESVEPMIQPITKPDVKPARPMRETDRPFLPKRKDKVNPKPKANVTEGGLSTVEFNGKQINVNSLKIEGVDRRDYPDFVDAFFTYGEYSDGMEMSDIELQKFTDENGELLNELIFDRQLYM
jgi:hypothetical protein